MKGGARAKLRRTHENRVAKECPRRRTGAQALGERVPRGQCQVGPCAPRARPLLVSRVHCGMMCQKKARKQASRQHRADLDETDRASPRRETVVALSQAATTQWSQPSLAVHFAAPCRPPRPECQRNGRHRHRREIHLKSIGMLVFRVRFFLRERKTFPPHREASGNGSMS